MTAVRPESSAGRQAGPPSYGDTAEFVAAVEQLADPLSDPLPGGHQPQQPSGYPPQDPGSGWYAAPPAHPQQQQSHHQQHQQHQQYAQPYPQAPQQPHPSSSAGLGYPQHGYEQPYEGYPTGYAPQAPHQAPPQDPHTPQQAPQAPESLYEPQQGLQPPQRPADGYQPEPGYETPAEPPRGRRRRPDVTAELPVADDPRAAERPGDGQEADFEADGEAPTGGRAERRKAARRGTGTGTGRRRTGAPEAAGPGTALAVPEQDADRLPVSRMEAKRAAKAAKSSPGVVVSQVVGELFISMGVLMLLFVVYQLWYTNVLADEAASGATNSLQHEWDSQKTTNDDNEPNSFPDGTNFAIIYIPKLDVKAPIAEGIEKDKILDKGEVGHYSGKQETAMPWNSTGNFALAGHRNTHGEPFRYINKLVPGDKVVVETSGMYYTYAITSMLPQTPPSNVSVIEPVPVGSGFTKPGRYITLTTCTPEFTSEYRMIVWGKMVAEQPRSKGTPAAMLGG